MNHFDFDLSKPLDLDFDMNSFSFLVSYTLTTPSWNTQSFTVIINLYTFSSWLTPWFFSRLDLLQGDSAFFTIKNTFLKCSKDHGNKINKSIVLYSSSSFISIFCKSLMTLWNSISCSTIDFFLHHLKWVELLF